MEERTSAYMEIACAPVRESTSHQCSGARSKNASRCFFVCVCFVFVWENVLFYTYRSAMSKVYTVQTSTQYLKAGPPSMPSTSPASLQHPRPRPSLNKWDASQHVQRNSQVSLLTSIYQHLLAPQSSPADLSLPPFLPPPLPRPPPQQLPRPLPPPPWPPLQFPLPPPLQQQFFVDPTQREY